VCVWVGNDDERETHKHTPFFVASLQMQRSLAASRPPPASAAPAGRPRRAVPQGRSVPAGAGARGRVPVPPRAAAAEGGQAAGAGATATTTTPPPPLSSAPSAPATDAASIPAGTAVYAIKDAAGVVQYVGMSRRLAGSVAAHVADIGAPTVSTVAWAPAPPSATRDELTAVWRAWVQAVVEETGSAPPGNLPGATAAWTPARKASAVPPEIRLTSGKGLEDLTVPLTTLIEAVVRDHAVVAFVKGTRFQPQCGFSHRVLTQLTETVGAAGFQVVNVLDEVYNPGLRDAIKEFSAWPTIPQVYVRGEFVGGADIVSELVESGELGRLVRGE
jgi:Grx4 family monothiol glutaredoxin